MFRVITEHPLASESDDHKHPEGIYHDNNVSIDFVNAVEHRFLRKINFMDLGCAGGALVCEMHERGHTAIGLEGSDHCLNIRQEMVEEVGGMPRGHENWAKYGNEILFTCDVTKKFKVLKDYNPFECDLITCWDVIEHFEEDDLDTFFTMVKNHMKDDALFISTIHMGVSSRSITSKNTPDWLNYHNCIHDQAWWEQKLSEYFKIVPYPFPCTNRGDAVNTALFTCIKL